MTSLIVTALTSAHGGLRLSVDGVPVPMFAAYLTVSVNRAIQIGLIQRVVGCQTDRRDRVKPIFTEEHLFDLSVNLLARCRVAFLTRLLDQIIHFGTGPRRETVVNVALEDVTDPVVRVRIIRPPAN